MSGVLTALVAHARERAKAIPPGEPAAAAARSRFADALRGKERFSVIAEYKQSSPSAGVISHARSIETQAQAYASAGAAALSVLTEPTRFSGSYEHLARAARSVDIPVLMKDFVVDVAQVRYAACLGASAVLLIVRCLSRPQLGELASACKAYGLVPLVECHDEDEVGRAIEIAEAVIGVNNRNLDTLTIDRALAPRLLAAIPAHRIAVAESGYERAEQTVELRGRADAILVGSALMRAPDPSALIRAFVS